MQLVIMQVHTVSDFGSFSTHPLYVLRIIVSKLGDIGEVLGCSRFKHGGGSVQIK